MRTRYRADYDVMFSIEDPFALGNREMALLLKKDSSKLSFMDKVKYVITNEGVRGLFKRGIRKIFAK